MGSSRNCKKLTKAVAGEGTSIVVCSKSLNSSIGGVVGNGGSEPKRVAIGVVGASLAKRAHDVASLHLVGLLNPNRVWAARIHNPVVDGSSACRIARLVTSVHVPPIGGVGSHLDKELTGFDDVETVSVAFEEEGNVECGVPCVDLNNGTSSHSRGDALIGGGGHVILYVCD